jgi:hypothetical protein
MLKRKITKFFFREQWSLLICGRDNRVLKQLVPEKDTHWADPFPVFFNGRFFIFIESQYKYENGVLGYIEIHEDLSPAPFVPILKKEYHLSWPNVFVLDGVWYMIPESSGNCSVDLYRAVDFPGQWEFHSTLLEGVRAVDTEVFRLGDTWWLFTSPEDREGSLNRELHVFWSKEFPSSRWERHPGNPVARNLSSARLGGKIFIDGSGFPVRPSQNCLTEYGREVKLNRINCIDREKYEEETVKIIRGERNLYAPCTHTYNAAGPYIVRDIKTRRFSPYPFR